MSEPQCELTSERSTPSGATWRAAERLRTVVVTALGALLFTACSSPGGPPVNDALESGTTTMVEIDSSDAVRQGLPPVAITVDTGSSGMSSRAFPSKGCFVQLSGPPGGPLGLRVDDYTGAKGDAAALERLARQRYGSEVVQVGTFERVELAGGSRAALTVVTGTSQARAAHLFALVPISANAERGVIVDGWIGASKGTPTPTEVLAHARLGAVLRTLVVRFE